MKFKQEIKKSGNSWAVIVPSDFVKHGLLEPNKVYEWEVKDNEQLLQDTAEYAASGERDTGEAGSE